MRLNAKRDRNHKIIVEALRKAGFGVIDLGAFGKGVPDLIASSKTKMKLFEIKMPGLEKKLTPDQVTFHANWPGVPIEIITTPEQAIAALR